MGGVTIPTDTITGVKEYGIMEESPGEGERSLPSGDSVSGVTIPIDTGTGVKDYGIILLLIIVILFNEGDTLQ